MVRTFKRKRGSSSGPSKRRRMVTGGKRRRVRVRGKRRGVVTKISRMPVPDRYRTVLYYSDAVSFNMTAADLVNIYRLRSSLHDPDVTAVGHRPMWTNQMSNLYKRYQVRGFKYRIAMKNSNVTQLVYGCIHHMPGSTLAGQGGTIDADVKTARERRGSRKFEVPASSGGVKVITGYVDVAKCWGITRSEFVGDSEYESLFGGTAAKYGEAVIYIATKNTSCIVHATIDIQLHVDLWDRIDASAS